jgi:hypothetical protein
MTKKQRSFLFFLMTFIFIIIGPIIVLYSQGYRVDFENKKIVQTGAFYFRVSPKSVQIEINLSNSKKRLGSTDFLFGTTYIENLLPKRYQVKIAKNGYHDWKKELEVNEKMATEIKNVTLIPENPNFKIELDTVADFFYFYDKNIFIIKKQKIDSWSLLKQDVKSEKFIDFLTLNNNEELIKIKPLNKENYLIVETKDKLKNNYYLINTGGEQDLIVLNLPEDSFNINFSPKEDNILMFQKENKIFKYNYQTNKTDPFLSNVLAYSFSLNQDFFWISNDGFLIKDIENPTKINKNNLDLSDLKNKEFEIFFLNPYKLSIKINNDFYFLDQKKSSFEKIFNSNMDPLISPNLDKLTYYNGGEVRILFLEKSNDQPKKNSMDNVFLTRFSEELKNINWFTSHYVMFTILDEIKIIEIDDRDNINLVNLAKFKEPKIIFNLINKKLYILSEEKLFVSDRLII